MKREIMTDDGKRLTYDESFWSGKRKIYVNGVECAKIGKTTYSYVNGEETASISIKGNILSGVSLEYDGKSYEVEAKTKWYEYVVVILCFMVTVIGGNIGILPMVGGAGGGLIAALAAIFSIMLMHKTKKPILKILIGLGLGAAGFIACVAVGITILGALA